MNACVFCGSSSGTDSSFAEEAAAVGAGIAVEGFGLVYGGACIGLMGVVADAALAHGARVTGILPEHLQRVEIAHRGLHQLIIVPDMHSRKAAMAESSDVFIALPGGLGTLEELFEVMTWAGIGLHKKPCLLLNTDGYYTQLIAFLKQAVEKGFIRPEGLDYLKVCNSPREIQQSLSVIRTS
ncbi:LOG family protein [Spirochaeta dissipatitropha]